MPPRRTRRAGSQGGFWRPWLIGILVLLAALALAAWGIGSRIAAQHRLRDRTEERSVLTVTVIKAASGPDSQELVLPGNVQSFYEAPIYARTSGYVKRWYTDIGTHVTAGTLLAEIDTPEVDDQLRQAEADLLTAQANARLARSTAKRWLSLLATDSVSKQETDEKVGDAEAKDALVAASAANVARLRQLESFKRVLAPFDGVVTARHTDVGALINAGSGVGPELFRVAQIDKLRVFIQVPQPYAPSVRPGIMTELHFAEYPGRSFPATLVRTANSIDPTPRTMLVELQIDNPKGELFAGGYTEVHLHLPSTGANVRLPVNTLLFRADGLLVATVEDDKITLKKVVIGRDFGTQVEITTGLSPGEQVVVNPPDSLAGGETVRVAPPKQPKEGQPGQGGEGNAAGQQNTGGEQNTGGKENTGGQQKQDQGAEAGGAAKQGQQKQSKESVDSAKAKEEEPGIVTDRRPTKDKDKDKEK